MYQNIQDIFVGREDVLDKALAFISATDRSSSSCPRLLTFKGPGGIGKTKVLGKLREQAIARLGVASTDVIDLRATSNRSSISFLHAVAVALESSAQTDTGIFTAFFEAIHKYNAARSQEKYALYGPTIQTFVDCCSALSSTIPVLILLDTFESVQDMQFGEWIMQLLQELRGSIVVAIAGRKELQVTGIERLNLEIGRLSTSEIDLLARQLFEHREIGIDYDLSYNTIKALENLTEGRPILVILAIEWILEDVEPEKIIAIPRDQFEPQIVRYLKNLDGNNAREEHLTIVMMATFNKRFDAHLLSLLTGWPEAQCLSITEKLRRFSFVKTIANPDPTREVITLHDEMLRLVNTYVDFPMSVKSQWRNTIVQAFYDVEIPCTADPQAQQALVAERLHYQLHYAPEEALLYFDQQIGRAIDGYEFEFCELLLSVAQDPDLKLDEHSRNLVNLSYAEMLVRRYQPFEAKALFDHLILAFDAERDTEFLSRSIGGLGACIANGATVIEANLSEAIDLWKESLEVCRAKGLQERQATILYQLGYCHDLLGQHEEALRYYGESNELAKQLGNLKLVTVTLDDMGRLRRKRYEVPESLSLFRESLAVKEEMGDTKSMGVSYHYLGDAFRDLDNFSEALKWYGLAEKARQEVADEYGLCVLYGDIGWLYLLAKNWEKAIEYTDKSYYNYAIPRHFGREMAEMEHSYYHIELETHGLDAAIPWIEKAFKNAEAYSNTFIYLDAALHLIEAAYTKKEFAKIPFYYTKMDLLDKKGCGYRMFRGRATNILGDIAHIQGDNVHAVDLWQEGYTIIAIHGRSRSSVLSFDDHLKLRIGTLTEALRSSGIERIEGFRTHWDNTILDSGSPRTLADEYPAVSGLCMNAEGDTHFGQGNYASALDCWAQGLLEIGLHLAIQDRRRVLTLDDFMGDRGSDIAYAADATQGKAVERVSKSLAAKNHVIDGAQLWRFAETLGQSIQGFGMAARDNAASGPSY